MPKLLAKAENKAAKAQAAAEAAAEAAKSGDAKLVEKSEKAAQKATDAAALVEYWKGQAAQAEEKYNALVGATALQQ